MDNNILTHEEQRLPKPILEKAMKSGNEFGWKQEDFTEVVEAARLNYLAIIGGQVQYSLPDGTCELYWLNYDPNKRQHNENWLTYCNRTAKECLNKFNKLISTTDIEKDALASFPFLSDKKKNGVDISEYLAFILYLTTRKLICLTRHKANESTAANKRFSAMPADTPQYQLQFSFHLLLRLTSRY